ncbi:hypothetical protein [Azospirillum agricola]|uniref:hypothetical protein n=1 Tax=Azospirillum agricola TaxID=1720247 RepID=UPI0011773B0F|nr:hypothetical protein [Azospirillum agricola]
MVTPRRLVLAALGEGLLARGGAAPAQARIDAEAKPALAHRIPDVLKTTDCHGHDAGTHTRMSVRAKLQALARPSGGPGVDAALAPPARVARA